MPLVAAKCTQCGANIEIDDSKEAGICKYCGTAFVTEKAINNYNINVTNNNNFYGANVTIQNDTEGIEQLVARAKAFETLDEYDQSLTIYREITSKYPMDYRGWLGIIISKTKDMTEISSSEYTHKEIIENFDKTIKVSSPIERENILKLKNEYEEKYKNVVDRHEDGKYIASICNLYDYRDVERALGCKCLTSGAHTFESFTFVLGNYVECTVSYMGLGYKDGNYEGKRQYTTDKSTCEKKVDRTNIKELLSGYKKKSENRGACYIATCIYGSYDCPQVWTLRRFRDYTLDETWYGRLFIKCYYAISPTLVKWFGETEWFRSFWKTKLDRMVANLNNKGVDDTKYIDKY